jgi:hypothetical protein
MRASTFAYLNHLPVTVYNYHQIKIGPWLRGEKSKRKYEGFFIFEKSLAGDLMDKMKVNRLDKMSLIHEPPLDKDEIELDKNYIFSEIPDYRHYFDGLQENRELVLSLFWELVSPRIKSRLKKLQSPCIGVHIRMGDFKVPAEGIAFGTVGHTRSPEQYFIEMVLAIRKMRGSCLPVSVFTDGRKEELKKLFQLENIYMVEGNNDLTDILLLSKSKIIITSAGSTFSYWAAFLSEAMVIMHPTYEGIKIRPGKMKEKVYEGALHEDNQRILGAIRAIRV